MITARDLQLAVKDLQKTRPGPGLLKTGISAALTLTLGYLALGTEPWPLFLALSFATGVSYAAWLITTHDAIHHTLTGWAWFDELEPRLIAWPIFWMHGMYAEVHKLHHKMNGDDLADPERVQRSVAEYEGAGRLGRFYVRHQWFIDVFVGGGFLLIYKTARACLKHYAKSRSIRRQVWLDLIGMTTANALVYAYAAWHGMALKYLVFWLLMERIGGAVLQWRAHIEHYGLWGKGRHYFETAAYNSRNLTTNAFGSWYFNRLNYHSVHHAFPRVPFYHLAEAHARFEALYGRADAGEALPQARGYIATAVRLARQPLLIGEVDPQSASGRRRMVTVAPFSKRQSHDTFGGGHP